MSILLAILIYGAATIVVVLALAVGAICVWIVIRAYTVDTVAITKQLLAEQRGRRVSRR
jgi:hypothetical protein